MYEHCELNCIIICGLDEFSICFQATQMNVLRRIEGVCWKDQISNDEILWRLGQVWVRGM